MQNSFEVAAVSLNEAQAGPLCRRSILSGQAGQGALPEHLGSKEAEWRDAVQFA